MRIGIYLGQRATGDHGRIDFAHIYDDRALNGSESSAVNLARGLAERGHEVHLHCPASTVAFTTCAALGGAHVWNSMDPHSNLWPYDAHVAVSEPRLLANKRGFKVAWHHLIDFPDDFDAGDVDAYVFDAPAHLREMREQYTVVDIAAGLGKAMWFPLSINLEMFDTKLPRRPYTMAWISSPDRGLHRLLELWPRIRARVPMASLRIYYRIQAWLDLWVGRADDSPMVDRANYIEQAFKILGRNGENGITVVGPATWNQFTAELTQTAVVPYTYEPVSPWSELFCVALVDACAAGCLPIASDLDVLGENFGGVVQTILGRPGDNQDVWVNAIVDALTEKSFTPDVRAGMRKFAAGLSRQRVAAIWESFLKHRHAVTFASVPAFARDY